MRFDHIFIQRYNFVILSVSWVQFHCVQPVNRFNSCIKYIWMCYANDVIYPADQRRHWLGNSLISASIFPYTKHISPLDWISNTDTHTHTTTQIRKHYIQPRLHHHSRSLNSIIFAYHCDCLLTNISQHHHHCWCQSICQYARRHEWIYNSI